MRLHGHRIIHRHRLRLTANNRHPPAISLPRQRPNSRRIPCHTQPQRNPATHPNRTVTAGNGGNSTVTKAGPSSHTGGVTLPSITT